MARLRIQHYTVVTLVMIRAVAAVLVCLSLCVLGQREQYTVQVYDGVVVICKRCYSSSESFFLFIYLFVCIVQCIAGRGENSRLQQLLYFKSSDNGGRLVSVLRWLFANHMLECLDLPNKQNSFGQVSIKSTQFLHTHDGARNTTTVESCQNKKIASHSPNTIFLDPFSARRGSTQEQCRTTLIYGYTGWRVGKNINEPIRRKSLS